ncbi:MAG: uracil-DNA glycosylase, partial [Sphaerochaeta sp.]
MSDILKKRDALASALQSFVDLCDEAEAVIGNAEVQGSGERDFSVLLDTLLPLPVDKDSIQGTNMRQLQMLAEGCTKC